MEKGSFGICKILDIMEECQAVPKSGKLNWPVSEKLKVPIAKRGKFMGPGNRGIPVSLSSDLPCFDVFTNPKINGWTP